MGWSWFRGRAALREAVRRWRESQARERRLEADLAALQAQLEAERARHEAREERLLDRVLMAHGTTAISDRPRPEAVKEVASPGVDLSRLQRAELAQWQQAAIEQGRAAVEGERLWWQRRMGSIPEHLRDPFEDILTNSTS